MKPHSKPFRCKNLHNICEKPSPDPELCLHCFFLKLNKDLEEISWKEWKNKDGKTVQETVYTKEISCQCGCNDVCPECDGKQFVDYCTGGEDSALGGCLICNEGGDPYESPYDTYEEYYGYA